MSQKGKESLNMNSTGTLGLCDGPSSVGTDLLQTMDSDLKGRPLSVSNFEETEFNYENVNSPGASSTSSEPVYVRQPGFDHHAHEFQVLSTIGVDECKPNIRIPYTEGNKTPVTMRSNFFPSPPSTPTNLLFSVIKKETVADGEAVASCQSQSKTGKHSPPGYTSNKSTKKKKSAPDSKDGAKPKIRKEPLPMKLRALPQSFWLQPNKNHNLPPSCSTLPPLILGKEVIDLTEDHLITPPSEKIGKDVPRNEKKGDRMIKVGNTDLLFRLFDTIERDDKKKPQVVRKGRPKKTYHALRKSRDDDPCLISAATESILPLLPERSTPGSSGSSTPLGVRQSQAQQVLEFVNLREGDRTLSLPSLNIDHNYSQLLSELELRL